VLAGEITFKIGEDVTVAVWAPAPSGRAGSLTPRKTRAPRLHGSCSFVPALAGGFFEESQRLQRSYDSFASEDVRDAYWRRRWEIIRPLPFLTASDPFCIKVADTKRPGRGRPMLCEPNATLLF
jgi:hypothetical protein